MANKNWGTSDILSLCYNDLDAHLKLCLLYMMLFPQEYNIPIRRLLRLWLAEGFVKPPEEPGKFQEDVVQGYFDDLVMRSLIQVSKLRSDGSPKICRLLGVLREYLLDKARDISLFHVHRTTDCRVQGKDIERRLIEYDDAKSCSLDLSQFQRLRSYISFNSQKKDTPAKGVGNLLSNMIGKGSGLLRVLDLEGVYKPSLPENLGDLFHLRYLGLRWTFLDKLPKSVGELTYLETLDLKRTCINRIPISIWKLKRLRHLNLNEISLDKDMPLPPLQTLWGVSVDLESPVKKCLRELNQLRELGISFRLNNPHNQLNVSQSREELLNWISELKALESLRLRSLDDSGRPSELSLMPLSDLVKLSNLNLLGKLQKLPERASVLDRSQAFDKNWGTSDILSLCYNDLDAHLKLCLLYMMLFPQEYNIPIRRLLRLWLAEGFVKPPEEPGKFQEDVVQGYFDDLVMRSLIQVSKLRSDGSPKICRLLGVLREYLLDKARDISLFHVHRTTDCRVQGKDIERRLIEYDDAKSCSLDLSQFQRLRSYISFNSQKKDTPAKGVGNLLSNMIGKGSGLLRVLDLEGVYKPSLPENLGDLFHLRYLGLRWTFLDKLPKSVGELTYLETLDLKRTCINRIPISIWKLKRLRHLNLNEISLDKDMPLPPLQTLWGVSVDLESPVKKCLRELNQLRELGISFRLNNPHNQLNVSQSREELLNWISELKALESLRLRSLDDSGRPSELSLMPLSDLVKLSNLNLLGKLQKLPERGQFPPNIKVLTLSVSHLVNDPMPILGQLPYLTVLRLLANSYNGNKILCKPKTFPELRVLNLWMLKDLKEWELGEGAMEKLKELNIRCCSKLKSIPSGLSQHKDFKDLILANMPQKFKEDVKKNIKKNFSKVFITVKNYDFTSLPWEQEHDAASIQNGEN